MLKYITQLFLFFAVGFIPLWMGAQATIVGIVRDLDTREAIEYANVYIKGTALSTETDSFGEYRLKVESAHQLTIVFSRVGYSEAEFTVPPLPAGSIRNVNADLAQQMSDVDITIRTGKIEDVGMITEEVTELKKLPTASGNFESILPHIALGTSGGTGGELSSQYNVRGGNYDENLVYVNDFEIFRPQLIRSSQQEGLSFPNIDMIRDISFSSGGFEARYGDKMSSVLDIRYKRPDRTAGSVSAGFLGASALLEGSKKLGSHAWNKLRYLVGARYKTTRYLLGSLDVTGEYAPNFSDIQSWITYDLSQSLQAGLLLNYNHSSYSFIPRERVSASGLFTQVLQLTTVFEGQEEDEFANAMAGISLTFIPERDRNPFFLKLLASFYDNYEKEFFDLLGHYRLSQVEFDLQGDGELNEVAVLGTGTQHLYARNRLDSDIKNMQLKGGWEINPSSGNSHFIQFGFKYQQENIEDRLSEWERIDSAGYSLPFSESEVLLNEVIKSENSINSFRVQTFVQNSYSIRGRGDLELRLTGGLRTHYWSFNEEWNISPRAQLYFKPGDWEKDVTFKLAGGIYYQPPFYRELRMPAGTVNPDIASQKSTHFVAGMSYDFDWKAISTRKFRFIAELYYKKLENLISYEIDNVRIRYSGENNAYGRVVGLDMRLNGEFVPGAESWVNLSILQARESLTGIEHLNFVPGGEAETIEYVPRPTDRFFNLSLFFQDYLPNNEDFKVNLNLTFGSGLPFGQKDNNLIYRNTFRYKNYQRVDIGFSYQLWDEKKRRQRPYHFLSFTQNSWVSLEVFNLLQIANVGSNTWIKTIGKQQYAIPNFLTSRRINLKFRIEI